MTGQSFESIDRSRLRLQPRLNGVDHPNAFQLPESELRNRTLYPRRAQRVPPSFALCINECACVHIFEVRLNFDDILDDFHRQDRLQDSCFLRLFVVVASYRRGSGRGPRLQVRSKMVLTTYTQHPQSVGRDSRDSRCTTVTRIPR